MVNVYRKDIDGLRAIAIISVILFHLGYLPNGYLGVDVFFVISGFLITGIIYKEIENKNFRIINFYESRIRRIVPLLLFTTITTFLFGILFMIPDDLENLCQSIFATNLFANNFLMKLTTADYWASNNEYKPLMHTWSLSIEEQFYILYPLIFIFFKRNAIKYIILFLSFISISFFFISNDVSSKFYFIQYRFFELSMGGIFNIFFLNQIAVYKYLKNIYILFLLYILIIFLLISPKNNYNDLNIIAITLITSLVLVMGSIQHEKNYTYKLLFTNKFIVSIGKISFSLYLWHQIVFAFSKYVLFEQITNTNSALLFLFIVFLSFLSYNYIEMPFRDKKFIKSKTLFPIIIITYIIIIFSSLYIYMIGGIIKDIPSLDLVKPQKVSELNIFNRRNNIHNRYNDNVRKFDMPFSSNYNNEIYKKPIKILVIGNSYARDLSNILLESDFIDSIELRYTDKNFKTDKSLIDKIKKSDFVFYGSDYPVLGEIIKLKIDIRKIWIFGIKDFGNTNGVHFNKKIFDYKTYRTPMKYGIKELNLKEKNIWKDRYIDIIDIISDGNNNVLVFTPDGKFISQDTYHLTKYGSIFLASLLNNKFRQILKIN